MVCPFFGAGTLESTGNSIIIFITINVRGAGVLIPSGTLQRHSRKYLSQSSLDPRLKPQHGFPREWGGWEIWNPFFHCRDSIHIPFWVRRKGIGYDIRLGHVVKLYQLVIDEILDSISQLHTFFQGMPFSPKNGAHIS